MSKLKNLLGELCPDGVEYKQLGEVSEISRGGNFQKKDYVENGFPCIHYGQIYTILGLFVYEAPTFISEERAKKQKKAQPGDVIMAVTSENIEDVCKCVAWLGDTEIAVSGHTAIIHSKLDPKYLVYYLRSSMFYTQKLKLAHGTKVIEVTPDTLNNIRIPVPPLDVQREIVRILDNFTELTTELTEELSEELTARRKQYEYYRDELLTFDTHVVWKTLGDIGKVSMCKRIMKNQTEAEGDVPFYKIGTFGKKADAFISQPLFDEYREKYSFPKKGDILISAAGTIGRTVVYDGKPAYFQDSNIVWIDNDETEVLNRFLNYWYQTSPWKASTGGTIARLYNDNIAGAKVPILPIETQKKIVSVLDNFDAICSDLNIGLPAEIDARQKQYEFYRDQLLTFAESGDTVDQIRSDQIRSDQIRSDQIRSGLIKLFQYVFGYAVVELNDVIVSLNTGLNPRQFFKLNTDDANNYYITIREIQNGRIVPTDKTDRINDKALELCNNRSNLDKGDVLFSGTGTIGETAVIEKKPENWNIKEGVYAIKPDHQMLDSYYLRFLLMTTKIKNGYMKKVAGGTVKSIPMKEMRLLKIPLPSLERQKEIVELVMKFDNLCSNISSGLPAEIEARRKQYEYYRDQLLTFTEKRV